MGCSLKQDFSYAIASSGVLTNIKNAIRTNQYTCPCCGGVMIPHMGKKNRWHFKHKSGTFCNFETYLHKIAKIRIREAFLKSERFEISFNPIHECSVQCPIRKNIPCRDHKYVKFDIRKYYNKCEEEASVDSFRADLLLTSKMFPNEPILIEIAVSHKSTAEKIKSGYRIIEISINSEEDITNIINENLIRGTVSDYRYNAGSIIFYNFNKQYSIKPDYDYFHDSKYYFWVKDDGEFGEDRMWCFEAPYSIPDDAHVILSDSHINWQWAFSLLQNRGLVNVINCLRCIFFKHTMYGDKICTLYKKYGTPKSPYIKQATTCPHYILSDKDENGTPISELYPSHDSRLRASRSQAYYKVIK